MSYPFPFGWLALQPGGSQKAEIPMECNSGKAEARRDQWDGESGELVGTFHSKAWKSVLFCGVGGVSAGRFSTGTT